MGIMEVVLSQWLRTCNVGALKIVTEEEIREYLKVAIFVYVKGEGQVRGFNV
jgi:hypothetical protein